MRPPQLITLDFSFKPACLGPRGGKVATESSSNDERACVVNADDDNDDDLNRMYVVIVRFLGGHWRERSGSQRRE